jgi:hypothetical protein
MNLQEKMFAEVEAWMAAGGVKTAFLEGKDYSEAKFNYWLAKWKANQMTSVDGFRELEANGWKEVKPGKVLEISFAATSW